MRRSNVSFDSIELTDSFDPQLFFPYLRLFVILSGENKWGEERKKKKTFTNFLPWNISGHPRWASWARNSEVCPWTAQKLFEYDLDVLSLFFLERVRECTLFFRKSSYREKKKIGNSFFFFPRWTGTRSTSPSSSSAPPGSLVLTSASGSGVVVTSLRSTPSGR